MKKKAASLLFFLVLACSVSASAAMRDFKKFRLNVPVGWTATENNDVLFLMSPGNTASVSIATDSAAGMNARELAEVMAETLKGSQPIAEKGGYSFLFDSGAGVETKAFLFIRNEQFVMITITGTDPQLNTVLGSISQKSFASPS